MKSSGHTPATGPLAQDPVRARAARRRKQQRELQAHALSYVVVNGVQVACWVFWTPDVFFWPLISLAGWGIGLAFHVWAVASSKNEEDLLST